MESCLLCAGLPGVVLVAVDALGLLVLLLVDERFVGLGEVAVVLSAHSLLFFVDAGFLVLELCSFARGELAALYALSDAVLLVLFALVDGG